MTEETTNKTITPETPEAPVAEVVPDKNPEALTSDELALIDKEIATAQKAEVVTAPPVVAVKEEKLLPVTTPAPEATTTPAVTPDEVNSLKEEIAGLKKEAVEREELVKQATAKIIAGRRSFANVTSQEAPKPALTKEEQYKTLSNEEAYNAFAKRFGGE